MPLIKGKKGYPFPSLLILILLLILAHQVAAQVPALELSLKDSVLLVTNEELADVTVQVRNNAEDSFRGKLVFSCAAGARVATKSQPDVAIPAGKSLFVPAKIYIGSTTLAGDIRYKVALYDLAGNILLDTTALLRLQPTRQVTMYLPENELILPDKGDLVKIPVVFSNRSNVATDVTAVFSFPAVLRDNTNQSIKFSIPPFHDTTLYFQRKVTKEMVQLEYMDLAVYGVHANGDYFAMSSLSLQTIKSRKKYGIKRLNDPMDRGANSVSAGIQNAFSSNESYFLRARGSFASQLGELSFSINALKWKNPAFPSLITDTWLGFSRRNFGLRVGNVIQKGELNFNGRGAEAYVFLDSAQQHKLFTGYIDKSFNLLDNANSSSFGKAAWVGYTRNTKKMLSNSVLSYDEDRYARTRSVLLVNDATWRLTDMLFASAKVGLANSSATYDGGESKPSFAAAATISGDLSKRISISSDNNFASGYYPGTRRGALSLNERVNFRMGKTIASGGFMYSHLNPQYFSGGGTFFRSNNKATTADIGLSRALGILNLALAGQYYQEQGNWYSSSTVMPGTMTAYRFNSTFSFTHVRSRQNLLLRMDGGQYTTDFLQDKKWQFRATLAYNFRFFRLNINLQRGNFFLSEAFQEYTGGQGRLRLNISPAIGGSLLARKLRYDAGLTYYKDFFTSSLMYNLSLQYDLGPTRIFGTLQYNTFANANSYRNIQFGITQLLPQSRSEEIQNKGAISMFVFYDFNSNGIFDAGDSLAAGYLASFEKTLLVSNNQGKIHYSHLPPAAYRVYFPTQKGWYSPDQLIMVGNKEEVQVQVPLVKTGTISGRIRFEYDELLSFAVDRDLAGQSVIATNTEGKSYETKTDDKGQYMLYLPTGNYTVTVAKLPHQIEVLTDGQNQQPVEVRSGKVLTGFDFILKVKQRKIDVKKFGQK